VESQHENKIPFLVYLPNVVRALQSALRSEVATLKLTKRNNRAYLTCDTQTPDAHVTHDIPIIVQSVKKLDDCQTRLYTLKRCLDCTRVLQTAVGQAAFNRHPHWPAARAPRF
jgi:hypothetical protein